MNVALKSNKKKLSVLLVISFPVLFLFQNCKMTSGLNSSNPDTVQPANPTISPIASPAVNSDGEPYGGKIQSYYALLSNFTCPDGKGSDVASPLGKIINNNGQYVLESLNCETAQIQVASDEIQTEIEGEDVFLIYKGRSFQYLKEPPKLEDPNFVFKEVGCIETFESIYNRKFGRPTLDLSSPDVENGSLVRYDRYDFSIYSNHQGNRTSKVQLKYFSPEIVSTYPSAQQIPSTWSQFFDNLIFRSLANELNWFSETFNLFIKFQPTSNGTDVTLAKLKFVTPENTSVGPIQGTCPILNRHP